MLIKENNSTVKYKIVDNQRKGRVIAKKQDNKTTTDFRLQTRNKTNRQQTATKTQQTGTASMTQHTKKINNSQVTTYKTQQPLGEGE